MLIPGPIPNVGQPGILVASEIPLQDAAVGRAVEYRAPRLQLPHPRRRFSRVQLGHSPVVHILPPAHCVGEMDFPIIAFIHVGQRGGNAPLSHDGVGFAQQALANQAHRYSLRRRLDGSAQSRPTGADYQNIVLECWIFRHRE